MRKLPALIVAVGLLAGLTACSTSQAPGSAGCTSPSSGGAAAAVTASGPVGSEPTVHIPTPIVTGLPDVETLVQGHGQVLTTGTPALIKYTIYSGTTGKQVSTSGYGAQSQPITVGATAGGPLVDALECAAVGSRIAVAVKASDLASTAGAPTTKSGPAYVAVIDVVKAFLPKANGALQFGKNNMPAVVTAKNGAPGITLPNIPAPTQEEVQVVRAGRGEKLTSKSIAVAQFTAIDWSTTPTVQGSTWNDGAAATTIKLDSTDVPESIRKAVIGQRVGSQIMVVIPPVAGASTSTTYVYVLDLLGAL